LSPAGVALAEEPERSILRDYLDRLAAERADDRGTLSLQLGFFNGVDDIGRKDGGTFEGGLEYRFGGLGYGLSPIVGLSVTADRSGYAYAGLRWELPVWQPAEKRGLYLDLSFAVSAYAKGHGRDLGGVLEFRSGAGLAYRFTEQLGLGFGGYHLSHTGINGSANPGADSLLLNLTWTY